MPGRPFGSSGDSGLSPAVQVPPATRYPYSERFRRLCVLFYSVTMKKDGKGWTRVDIVKGSVLQAAKGEAVLAAMRTAFAPGLSAVIRDGASHWFLAQEQGIPVGITVLEAEKGEEEGYLHLFVLPQYRKRGIGCTLTRQALELAKQLGLHAVGGDYDCADSRAARFALNIGFQRQFVSRYMGYQGGFLPEAKLEFVPYREEYFEQMQELISGAFYEMRRANDLKPYRFFWSEADRKEFSEHASDFFLLFEQGEMVASGYAYGGEIDQIAVRQEYRGKGLGRAVVSHGVNQSLRQGHSNIFLWVLEWNRPAWTLYESLGFVTKVRHQFGRIPL